MFTSENGHEPSDRITLRFLAAPADVTAHGDSVPAGRVLEWIDKAAYACAVGWARTYCVTAYVGNVHFTRSIRPGALVQVHARIVYTGRTSMHLLVTVEASDVRDRDYSSAMHCMLVFVAVDEDGSPIAVQPWTPSSATDSELQQLVADRIEPRRAIQRAMAAQEYSNAGTTPQTVFRFLAAPADANWGGKAHGGTVMRWIDEAAYACAASWSSARAVAVYSGGIQFYAPIVIGHIVEVRARLIHTTTRSMHISVSVSSGAPGQPLTITTRSMTVFVDVLPTETAANVEPLPLSSTEDRRLSEHAEELVRLRQTMPALPASVTH
ncbi:hotdog domain-containing protein [Arthrobacter sp. B0490]|uniref:acyl-CoA thioesterase n=1 Tax=Arthrobacter sp. B0490 TaxID=2058891 RepID=UPI000CE4600F|nr:hotdog domain-containing protein [Arthrobacter sp. B0490]